jgi:YNFM family putative membrane transporter
MPEPRGFAPASVAPRAAARTLGGRLRNPLLLRLYTLGLLFMSVCGAVYTVAGYRLTAGPFGLSQDTAGLIFISCLAGTASSAGAGRLAARLGRRGALYPAIGTTTAGLLLSIPDNLLCVLGALVLITAGFFAGHSVASVGVVRTATAGRAQASTMYTAAYYAGNSIGGAAGADAYHRAGWNATDLICLAAMGLACLVTLDASWRARAERAAPQAIAAPAP